MILAIDPGPTHSAYVLLHHDGKPDEFGKLENERWAEGLAAIAPSLSPDSTIAIEMIASYGMPVGAEVFETCVWIGRFVEICHPREVRRIKRGEVKTHLCRSQKAKDSNIRQALVDRYGGKERAIGTKAKPGPLYGIKADCWAALAVAVTAMDTEAVGARAA